MKHLLFVFILFAPVVQAQDSTAVIIDRCEMVQSAVVCDAGSESYVLYGIEATHEHADSVLTRLLTQGQLYGREAIIWPVGDGVILGMTMWEYTANEMLVSLGLAALKEDVEARSITYAYVR